MEKSKKKHRHNVLDVYDRLPTLLDFGTFVDPAFRKHRHPKRITQLERMTEQEHREHPWLTYSEAERVAKDHIRLHKKE